MENKNALVLGETRHETLNWDEIYDALLPRIFNYFLYRTGKDEIAQDLTGMVFERAWIKKEHYRANRAKVEAWIFGIARNVFREYLRDHKKSTQNLLLLDDKTTGAVTFPTEILDRNILLTRLLEQLREKDRELIALKYGAGMNNREIARLTHLSESNVGTRVFRAISSLRAQLEENNE